MLRCARNDDSAGGVSLVSPLTLSQLFFIKNSRPFNTLFLLDCLKKRLLFLHSLNKRLNVLNNLQKNIVIIKSYCKIQPPLLHCKKEAVLLSVLNSHFFYTLLMFKCFRRCLAAIRLLKNSERGKFIFAGNMIKFAAKPAPDFLTKFYCRSKYSCLIVRHSGNTAWQTPCRK